MPVKRRRAKFRRLDVSDVVFAILHDLPIPKVPPERAFEVFAHTRRPRKGDLAVRTIEEYWEEHAAGIVAEWAAENPGTRPSCWWHFFSPRWSRQIDVCEPRARMGGGGVSVHELPPEPGERFLWRHFAFGLSLEWETDPPQDQPALFESEAAYLKRHGLLLDREQERLAAADFEPEAVLPEPVLPDEA